MVIIVMQWVMGEFLDNGFGEIRGKLEKEGLLKIGLKQSMENKLGLGASCCARWPSRDTTEVYAPC